MDPDLRPGSQSAGSAVRALRRSLAAAVLPLALSACSSAEKKAKEEASWDAAARMTVQAWLEGSVSQRFAADALAPGNRATKSSRYEAARRAVLGNDRGAAHSAIGQ